jgi:hypothetical protein
VIPTALLFGIGAFVTSVATPPDNSTAGASLTTSRFENRTRITKNENGAVGGGKRLCFGYA